MAVPPPLTDDAPTTPIARADLRRAAAPRRSAPTAVVAGAVAVTLLLVVAAVAVFSLAGGTTPAPPGPVPAAAPAPPAPTTAPSRPAVPVGGVLFTFEGSPNDAADVAADGSVVAVLDDMATSPSGANSTQLVTYDQTTGERLAVAGPDLPEMRDCGVGVVRRPDGTSVVLTRYDTEVQASGVQLGRREAHVAARDGRTLRPLWDVVLHSGDTTDQVLLVDTVCHDGRQVFAPSADGRFVLNRSFDVSRLIDLGTGAMRPVPFAVNVVGDDVVVAVPPPRQEGDVPPDPLGPGTVEAVRLVSSSDLRTRSTIPAGEVASALARVGPAGRPTLDGFVSSGSDTRFVGPSLSGDGRTLAVRERDRVSLVELPSGRIRTTIPTGSTTDPAVHDPSERPLAIVPGDGNGRDVVLVATLRRGNDGPQDDVYTAYDLAGRRLWALAPGAADDICQIDRGLLLLRAAGLTSLDPATGAQLTVDQDAGCLSVTGGLGVTSTQGTAASTSATYTVTVLHRP